MPSYQVKRCFIALPPDEVLTADLAEVMEGIEIDGLRPTRPENLHVTLKFLGDVEDPDIPRIIDALRGVAAACEPFELNIASIAYLPDARRPRVLSAEGDVPAELKRMFQAVEEAVLKLGFPREGRAYHPHITLGRFRKPPRHLPSPDTFRFPPTTLPVDRFVLMQSVLTGPSPAYIPLADFPLGPARRAV